MPNSENKYRYLVPWMTCQFVYQIVFLVTVTMYAWTIYIDDNYEYCCTLRRLKETVEILELLNLFHLWCLQFWGAKLNKRFADWYSYTDNIGGVAWYGNHELRNPVLAPSRVKVSVKENEVPTEKNSSRASIFATKASYISN